MKKKGPFVVGSLAKVAAFWGITETTIKRDWKPAGMPGKPKCWDLAAIARWQRKRWAKRAKATAGPDHRLKVAQAAREELRLGKEQEKLVNANDVRLDRLRLVRWMKGIFDRAGSELSMQLSGRKPPEVRRFVDEYFLKVATDICAHPEKTPLR